MKDTFRKKNCRKWRFFFCIGEKLWELLYIVRCAVVKSERMTENQQSILYASAKTVKRELFLIDSRVKQG
nr:MAG TPA: hypothetical protein [Caudoviricetes sp.]